MSGLPAHSFNTDRLGLATKCSTEAIITDARERELDVLGFIPLCHCQDTELSAFYTTASIQRPEQYEDPRPQPTPGFRRCCSISSASRGSLTT